MTPATLPDPRALEHAAQVLGREAAREQDTARRCARPRRQLLHQRAALALRGEVEEVRQAFDEQLCRP